MREMHEEKEIKRSYQRRKAQTRPKTKCARWKEWEKSVWEKLDSFSIERDMKKWDLISRWSYIKKSQLDGSSICWDLSCTKSRQIESVEVLSRICQQQKHLDGLKSYREAIGQTKTFSMDRESVEKLSRQISNSLMDWRCDKICLEKESKALDR